MAGPAWYMADEPLRVGGVVAFTPGMRVPAGHVERHGWQEKVHAAAETAVVLPPGFATTAENDDQAAAVPQSEE